MKTRRGQKRVREDESECEDGEKRSPQNFVGTENPVNLRRSRRLRRNSPSRSSRDLQRGVATPFPLGSLRVTLRVSVRECASCSAIHPYKRFPALTGCPHEPDTCLECFNGWINAQLDTVNWDQIQCPSHGCGLKIPYHDIQMHATTETYTRFDNAAYLSALSGDPDFRWCQRPGCGMGQIHDGGQDNNIFTCATCQFRVCIIHDTAWHEGETCREYDLRKTQQRQNEENDLKELARISKKCPGESCGWNIQKDGGCDHMTCRRCGHQFCWLCLAPWDPIIREGNHLHGRECLHYRRYPSLEVERLTPGVEEPTHRPRPVARRR